MKFWKYHGLGNDFVLVENLDGKAPKDPDHVRVVCHRRFGVGADGILYLERSEKADYAMRVMNSDGSEAEMCGNGLRCLAKHIYDLGHISRTEMSIETPAGVMHIKVEVEGGKVSTATVDMGGPILDCPAIPMVCQGRFIDQPINVGGRELHGSAVSMGNPHLIIFDELDQEEMDRFGPLLERHELFPRKTNVEFVKSVDGILELKVYERGAGWTMACGTGACATVVAAALLGKAHFNEEVQVRLPGGGLWIKVWKDLSKVTMRGPASLVFEGQI
ncbi:MAG: diaminopimelate epimerase [Methanomassiliicoccales archaeon]|nr:diaminopimelate epimerase [Methanomassiliicoccales archaeon]TFG55957.1 MAG: diaminopimelate epimerase [Methanomassiliicoccus sp.]